MESSDKNSESETNMSTLFDSAFALFNSLENTEEPTNSLNVQLRVKKCMKMLEDATKLVSMADIFSKNEDFEEIPTENMKYFLLPALLGTLATKLCEKTNRMYYVNISEVYFYDFLERVKSYGIIDIEIPKRKTKTEDGASSNQELAMKPQVSNTKMIEGMVNTRESKLKRYREEQELKEQLKILKTSMENLNIDDETIRKYFVTLIKSYAMQAVEEINSLGQEKEILEHMEKMGKEGNEELKKNKDYKPPKLRPVIITRNEAQKEVFGAGYPSLPVMTVEEFYEKKIADGEWSANAATKLGGKSLQEMAAAEGTSEEHPEDLEKERKTEEDDEEFLQRQRAMDEYKDEHRRGWGNRYNRS